MTCLFINYIKFNKVAGKAIEKSHQKIQVLAEFVLHQSSEEPCGEVQWRHQ